MEANTVNPWVWVLLAAAGAYLTVAPGVLQGFVDAYVIAPLQRLTQPSLRKKDVRLGEKLAQGGFGTVYLGTSATTIPGKVNAGEVRAQSHRHRFSHHLPTCTPRRSHSLRW